MSQISALYSFENHSKILHNFSFSEHSFDYQLGFLITKAKRYNYYMNNNNKRHKNNLNHLYIHLKFMKVETSLLQPTKRKMNSQNNKKFMNTPSETLSDEENEAIFALLGSKCLVNNTFSSN